MLCACGEQSETTAPVPLCRACAIEWYSKLLTWNEARRDVRPLHAYIAAEQRAEEQRIYMEMARSFEERKAISKQAAAVNDGKYKRPDRGRPTVVYAAPLKDTA